MGNGFKSIAFLGILFVMSHILQLTQHEIHIKEMFNIKRENKADIGLL